jgi:hypothetical protein
MASSAAIISSCRRMWVTWGRWSARIIPPRPSAPLFCHHSHCAPSTPDSWSPAVSADAIAGEPPEFSVASTGHMLARSRATCTAMTASRLIGRGRVLWIQVSHGVMPVFVDCRMQVVSQFASSHHSVQRVTAPVRMEQAQSEAGMCGTHARFWPPHCTAPFEFILVECTGWHRHDHWKHAT